MMKISLALFVFLAPLDVALGGSSQFRGSSPIIDCSKYPDASDCKQIVPSVGRRLEPITVGGVLVSIGVSLAAAAITAAVGALVGDQSTNPSVAGMKVTITGDADSFEFKMTGGRIARGVNFAPTGVPKVFSINAADGTKYWKLTFTELRFGILNDDSIHVKYTIRHMIDLHPEDGTVSKDISGEVDVEADDKNKRFDYDCDHHGQHQDCVSGDLKVTAIADGTGTADDIETWELIIAADHFSFAYTGGDPHFQTWIGETYDFHGECDLVFLDAPNFGNGLGLKIHIRTRARELYSYIETAALRIGNSILEVGSFGDYALDGVNYADLKEPGATLGGFPVHHSQPEPKKNFFEIIIDEQESIQIISFKDMVSVKLHGGGSSHHFKNSVGLIGSHDHNGSMLARDGATVMTDPNAFGQEWQVQEQEPKLFRTNRSPQLPTEQCRLPQAENVERRRLEGSKVSREEAESACKDLANAGDKRDCIFDVLATGDLEVALAYDSE